MLLNVYHLNLLPFVRKLFILTTSQMRKCLRAGAWELLPKAASPNSEAPSGPGHLLDLRLLSPSTMDVIAFLPASIQSRHPSLHRPSVPGEALGPAEEVTRFEHEVQVFSLPL